MNVNIISTPLVSGRNGKTLEKNIALNLGTSNIAYADHRLAAQRFKIERRPQLEAV